MRIILAGPEYEENLSIRYLASSLAAAGHEAVIVPFNEREDIPAVVEAARGAAVAGLSICFQARAREFFDLAGALKAAEPSVRVVAGGHYASCAATDILAHVPAVDLVVIHEGEETLTEIAALDTWTPAALSRLLGIVYRDGSVTRRTPPRRMIEDLDRLPWPERRGPVRLLAGVPTSYVMGSRGCLGACDYCCITTLHRLVPGRRFRQRDPESIADEMAALYHRRGTRQFIFHDDNFLVPSVEKNVARLEALQRGLDRRRVGEIALVIKCRPAEVRPEIFARLRGMGLLRVFLGIESGSAGGLASLGRRQTVEDEDRAIDICNSLGISVQYTIMTFHPEATPETIRADLAFMRRHIDNPLNFCRAEIYAGTPLERRMIEAGRARGNWLARTYRITDPAADLAASIATRLFMGRCWGSVSLMNTQIRTDHLAAIMGRFYRGPEVDDSREEVRTWRLAVNRNSLDLLERLVEACAVARGSLDPGLAQFLEGFAAEEERTRLSLMAQAVDLRTRLDRIVFAHVGLTRDGGRIRRSPVPIRGLARHAAAVLIALGIAGAGCGTESSEMAAPPLDAAGLNDCCEPAARPLDGGNDGGNQFPDISTDFGALDDAGRPLDDAGFTETCSTEDAGRPLDDGGGEDAEK